MDGGEKKIRVTSTIDPIQKRKLAILNKIKESEVKLKKCQQIQNQNTLKNTDLSEIISFEVSDAINLGVEFILSQIDPEEYNESVIKQLEEELQKRYLARIEIQALKGKDAERKQRALKSEEQENELERKKISLFRKGATNIMSQIMLRQIDWGYQAELFGFRKDEDVMNWITEKFAESNGEVDWAWLAKDQKLGTPEAARQKGLSILGIEDN